MQSFASIKWSIYILCFNTLRCIIIHYNDKINCIFSENTTFPFEFGFCWKHQDDYTNQVWNITEKRIDYILNLWKLKFVNGGLHIIHRLSRNMKYIIICLFFFIFTNNFMIDKYNFISSVSSFYYGGIM